MIYLMTPISGSILETWRKNKTLVFSYKDNIHLLDNSSTKLDLTSMLFKLQAVLQQHKQTENYELPTTNRHTSIYRNIYVHSTNGLRS